MPSLTPGRFVGQTLDLRATSSQRGMPSRQVAEIGGTGFSPLALAGLQVWLDASDTSTITSSGSPAKVSQWNDKSGNGYHVSQATSSAQPTTGATTQNSLNILDFDGGDHLQRTQNLFGIAYTLFVVAKFANTTTRYAVCDIGNYNATGRALCIEQNTFSTAGSLYGFYTNNTAFDSSIATSAGAKVFTASAVASGSITGRTTYRVNGVSSGLTVRSALSDYGDMTGTNGFTLGGFRTDTTSTLQLNGSICEFIAFNRRFTVGEIQTIETYLRTKWAI